MVRTNVKEFFVSIQGEGPFVGYRQLFIRFCRCNLNCMYCDTEFKADTSTQEYTPHELLVAIKKMDLTGVHSISLTGGEPLLDVEFLKEFLPLLKAEKIGQIYLETNATLFENYLEIAPWIDIVSADIKLASATGINGLSEKHDKFFALCAHKDCYVKVVFDSKIKREEIVETCDLARKYGFEIVLSPMMISKKMSVDSAFVSMVLDEYLKCYNKVRVIPQVHKFIGVE